MDEKYMRALIDIARELPEATHEMVDHLARERCDEVDVEIKTYVGPDTFRPAEWRTETVKARVFEAPFQSKTPEGFALHPDITHRGYAITHLGTGLAVAKDQTGDVDEAKKTVARLRKRIGVAGVRKSVAEARRLAKEATHD